MSSNVIVSFQFVPTSNPDNPQRGRHFVYNMDHGVGMDVLRKVVEEYVPHVDDKEVRTEKRIIYVYRYECPCCPTGLSALVEVTTTGLCTERCKEVAGLYSVQIDGVWGKTYSTFSIQKNQWIWTDICKGQAGDVPHVFGQQSGNKQVE